MATAPALGRGGALRGREVAGRLVKEQEPEDTEWEGKEKGEGEGEGPVEEACRGVEWHRRALHGGGECFNQVG